MLPFSLGIDSAPGLDGFSGVFYTHWWDIITPDVLQIVRDFFAGVPFSKSFTSTLLVLVPKTQSPTSFSQCRLISLCNYYNKIVTRVLAMRLSRLLPKLFSSNQAGFVMGRDIF